MKKLVVIAFASLALSGVTRADLLVGWDFGGLAGITSGSVTSNVAHASGDMTDTSLMLISRGSGLTPSSNTGGYAANAWATTAFDTTDYFEFNAASDGGWQFDVTNVIFNIRRSTSGPSNFVVRSSVDNFASDLSTFVAVANSTYSSSLNLSGQTGVTLRLYGYGATAANGSANLGGTGNDLVLEGTMAVVPEPGTLAGLSLGLLALYGARRRKMRG
jgi:hypothetical protein